MKDQGLPEIFLSSAAEDRITSTPLFSTQTNLLTSLASPRTIKVLNIIKAYECASSYPNITLMCVLVSLYHTNVRPNILISH